jgi:hypothetical protein
VVSEDAFEFGSIGVEQVVLALIHFKFQIHAQKNFLKITGWKIGDTL